MTYLELHPIGSIAAHEELPPVVRANLLAIVRRFWEGKRFYDEGGAVWECCPEPGQIAPPSLVTRVLANTIYNPTRHVRFRYSRAGSYDLSELKARIRDAVAQDDDILTQFMDAEEIFLALEEARTFGSVVALLDRMHGAGEEAQP